MTKKKARKALKHCSRVIDLGTTNEVLRAANAPVKDIDWIPYLEQLIAQRKYG